jgi:hypothetical protein
METQHDCENRKPSENKTALSFHIVKSELDWELLVVGLPYPSKTECIPISFCPFCGVKLTE